MKMSEEWREGDFNTKDWFSHAKFIFVVLTLQQELQLLAQNLQNRRMGTDQGHEIPLPLDPFSMKEAVSHSTSETNISAVCSPERWALSLEPSYFSATLDPNPALPSRLPLSTRRTAKAEDA